MNLAWTKVLLTNKNTMCLEVIKAKNKTLDLTLCNGGTRRITVTEKEYLQLRELFKKYDIGIKTLVVVEDKIS